MDIGIKQISALLAKELEDRYGIEANDVVCSKIEDVVRNDETKNKFEKFTLMVNQKEHNSFWQEIIEKTTIHESYFQRDKNILNAISIVVNDIFAGKKMIKIWSVPCSTGEEAYDLTFMAVERLFQKIYGTSTLNDAMLEKLPLENIYVYATDISEICLKTARLGLYNNLPMGPLRKLDPLRRKCYFIEKENNIYEVKKFIKRCIKFAVANILDDPMHESFDIIVCRNMMIYFSQNQKLACQEKLYQSLLPGGYLFLGSVDTLLLDQSKFDQFSDGSSIWYRKREG